MPTNNASEPHAGRVALVTGTTRGIGQAIAVGLAQRLMTIAACSQCWPSCVLKHSGLAAQNWTRAVEALTE